VQRPKGRKRLQQHEVQGSWRTSSLCPFFIGHPNGVARVPLDGQMIRQAPDSNGGPSWWAHFAFTRINTTPTFLCKKIEGLREVAENAGLRISYSVRRASKGLRRAPRRAGSQHATSATVNNRTVVAANTTGSRALTP
jgi:hypothetical protein